MSKSIFEEMGGTYVKRRLSERAIVLCAIFTKNPFSRN